MSKVDTTARYNRALRILTEKDEKVFFVIKFLLYERLRLEIIVDFVRDNGVLLKAHNSLPVSPLAAKEGNYEGVQSELNPEDKFVTERNNLLLKYYVQQKSSS